MVALCLFCFIVVIFTAATYTFMSKSKVLSASTEQLKNQSASRVLAAVVPTLNIPTITPTPVIAERQHIQLGVAIEDYSNKFGTLTTLERQLGTTITTISIFKQFGNPENRNFNAEELAYVKASGKTVLLAWEPWDPAQGMKQSVDYLTQITSGQQDDYIKSFAQAIQTYGAPVTIRFGHEMNGNWYPWGLRPEDYKNAYKYVVKMFDQAHVTNVRWMWSVNAENVPSSPISEAEKYYPGDDVVDEIGIDGFNFGTSKPGSSWRSFAQIFTPAYQFARHLKRPITISEVASAEEGGNKAEWVKSMLYLDLPTSFSSVKRVIWFNILKEADWRINSSKSSLQAFRDNL